jgi:catechol 2,3-dioxygenase-like lactoylglutathione lyase family enzyme
MTIQAKYVHTNLIARDWRKLADFYIQVFGCRPVPPERNIQGEALEAGTGIPGAHLTGVHLRLPGWGEDGPTLELFHYDRLAGELRPEVNRPGYGHLAFQVEDVGSARDAVLQAGGGAVGEVVSLTIASGAVATWCYVRDPEGNILELQAWA